MNGISALLEETQRDDLSPPSEDTPRSVRNKFLSFKPPCPWNSVIAIPTD